VQRYAPELSLGHPRPRVINVDGNLSYPKVIAELKYTGELARRCRRRPVRYLNNIVEKDHRAIKRRVRASQGFRSFDSAARTIQAIELATPPIITVPVRASPVAKETADRIASRITSGLPRIFRSRTTQPCRLLSLFS
jgi:hypothetical protein